MSSSSTPAPHPKLAERLTTSPPAILVNIQPESPASIHEYQTEERSEAYQTEPVATSPVPELPPSSINTDVRRRGLNPFLTGVMAGIIAFIIGFLLIFAYLVVFYLRYTDG